MARESKERVYTEDEIVEQIKDWAFTTTSALSYFNGNGTIKYKKLRENVRDNPIIEDEYEKAKILRADSELDRFDSLQEMVLEGAVAPDVARVSFQAMQWKIQVLSKGKYSTKVEVESKNTNINHTVTGMEVR